MKLKCLLSVLVAVLAAAAGWYFLSGRSVARQGEDAGPAAEKAERPRQIPDVGKSASEKPVAKAASPSPAKGKKSLPKGMLKVLIKEAMETANFKALNALVENARNSPDPAVRMAVVDTLAYYESNAADSLATFIDDQDPEVRARAIVVTDVAVNSIPGDYKKADVILKVMGKVRDTETLDSFAAKLETISAKEASQAIISAYLNREKSPLVWSSMLKEWHYLTGKEFSVRAATRWGQEN